MLATRMCSSAQGCVVLRVAPLLHKWCIKFKKCKVLMSTPGFLEFRRDNYIPGILKGSLFLINVTITVCQPHWGSIFYLNIMVSIRIWPIPVASEQDANTGGDTSKSNVCEHFWGISSSPSFHTLTSRAKCKFLWRLPKLITCLGLEKLTWGCAWGPSLLGNRTGGWILSIC